MAKEMSGFDKMCAVAAKAEEERKKQAPEEAAYLAKCLSKVDKEARQAFEDCRKRMVEEKVVGEERGVFLGPTDTDQSNKQWARALGERLGSARMHLVAELLKLFVRSSLHENAHEFTLDLRDLDMAWDGIDGWRM
jgi:hypothetical protein